MPFSLDKAARARQTVRIGTIVLVEEV